MKITNVEVIEVFVPYIAPIRNVNWSDREKTIVKIHTDEGLVGLGEVWEKCDAIQQSVDGFIGKDPLMMDLENASAPWQSALYDVVAQAKEVPVWRLLGDKVRDKVPVAYWSCHMPPEETAKEAEKAAALGFTVHKLKARSEDIVRQAELMTQATEGVDYAIRVDPNTQFKYTATAVRLARELEPYNIECYEDPVLKESINLPWYSLLRHKTDIPQALHLGAPQAVLSAVKAEAVDRFNISGNVATVKKCAAIAEAASCPIWLQTAGLCLGIQAAFSTHLQATLRNDLVPCDELPFVRDNDLLGGSLELKEGHFIVPTGNGLGITLDQDAVAHYRTR
jgi:L-alanine-DL-glutamate epimerase-like enolase superfamily enzyme